MGIIKEADSVLTSSKMKAYSGIVSFLVGFFGISPDNSLVTPYLRKICQRS